MHNKIAIFLNEGIWKRRLQNVGHFVQGSLFSYTRLSDDSKKWHGLLNPR